MCEGVCVRVQNWPWPVRMCIVCGRECQGKVFEFRSEGFQFQSPSGGEICCRFRHPKVISLFSRLTVWRNRRADV